VNSMRRDATGTTLTLFNPTAFPARVAILAEGAPQAKVPLGTTAFLKWPYVDVAAGATVTFALARTAP
jgi:hypothetical protein